MTKKIIIFFVILTFPYFLITSASSTDQKFCDQFSEQIESPKIQLIEVKINDYKKWTENGIKIIIGNFRWVPTKFKKRFKTKIVVTYVNNKRCEFKARVRHNGNQKDHIRLINNSNAIIQSLDVNLLSGNIYGIKKFKLLLDNTRGVLEDEIFLTTLLRKFDYLAPRTMYLNVNQNGSLLKMIFQENPTKEMLSYSSRAEGPIFRGDERFFFKMAEKLPDSNLSNDSLGMVPLLEDGVRTMLVKQHNSEIILKNKFFLKSSTESFSNLSLIYLFYSNVFKDEKNNFQYSHYTLNNELLAFHQPDKILQLDVYNLLLNSANALHSLSVNNRKFYWNINKNYFEPINYDNNADFTRTPNIIILPVTKSIDKAFLSLNNLLENVNIKTLNKEINLSGVKQDIKLTKNKINQIKKNLTTVKKIYNDYDKDIIEYNYKKKITKEMWSAYYKALLKIDKNIKTVKKIDKGFQVCDLKLKCEIKNFSILEIKKLLNGDMVLENIEYQYIGSDFENNEILKKLL